MSPGDYVLHGALVAMLAAPAFLLATLALPAMLRMPLGERATNALTRLAMLTSFGASAAALLTYLWSGAVPRVVSAGVWFSLGHGDFAFDFVLDGFSLGFAVLATGICGIAAGFSSRYLHREPGFTRYFIQLSMFVLGITLVALAASIEVLFAGWELLGLSSALLVGFFHERRAPIDNALRLFAVYRASDAAMLSAAVLLHHWAGSGSMSTVFAGDLSAGGLEPGQSFIIAMLILIAVAGKSALLPFSGWLPRAMEGPTSSSAVYYGALSIHAGCFLLLRTQPLLVHSTTAQVIAGLVGAATAIHATMAGRVQTDVKSALAYGALTQVGVIVVEIALGLTSLAFVHICGHACFRLLQLLSAPNILHDIHELENRVSLHGRHEPARAPNAAPIAPGLYLVALERGFADAILDRGIAAPFRRAVMWLDRLDRLLSGSRRPHDGAQPPGGSP